MVISEFQEEIEDKGYECPNPEFEPISIEECRKLLFDCSNTDVDIKAVLIRHYEFQNQLLKFQIEEAKVEIEKNVYRTEVQTRVKALPSEEIADKVLRYERSIEKSIFQKIVMLKNLQGSRTA